MRLFLAIPIEESILSALAGGTERLRETRAPVRWVRPEGMHLTLKFLGETQTGRVEPLVQAVEGITKNIMPFPMSVHGAGAYPNLKRPRVLWAGVIEDSGALLRLVDGLEEAAAAHGWEREKRRFSPHVTFGRIRGNMNLGRLAHAVESLEGEHWGDQEAREVVLYSSELQPGGAVYCKVHVFRLGE